MKKPIATILIILMILSLAFNVFLYKPKKAKALFGIGDISIDIVAQIKDWIVDEIPRRVARHMMVRLQQEVSRWAQGGFTDENKPFAMTSWKNEVLDALNLASAKFIEEFGLTPLCQPIRFNLGQRLGIAQFYNVPYTQYAACTMEKVVENVADFWENPSITMYGWDTWTALVQPQNNIFGGFFLATEREEEIESQEIESKKQEIQQGYGPEKECLEYQAMDDEEMAACENDCYVQGVEEGVSWTEQCLSECQNRNSGICLEYRTKTPGSIIHSTLEKAIGSDIDWLISADEISEMFGLIFSSLFNKLIYGTGIASKPFYQPAQFSYQAQTDYYKSYKKTLSFEDVRKLKNDILNNILKSIKRITTSTYECDKENQLEQEVFNEITAEILDEEAQHLYTAIEGVDLQADFIVLNKNQDWDDIAFNKYPVKCSKITETKCNNISSGLPYELNLNNINAQCATGCLSEINKELKECENKRKTCLADCSSFDTECAAVCNNQYIACEDAAITTAVNEGRCSTYAIGRACLDGAILINKAKNRCDECIKEAKIQCEIEPTEEERRNCINLYCSEYEDINPTIVDGEDFYDRCKLADKREACYVCLKEYFMPAQYCLTIYDYINRAFVKYPALVYHNLWWGPFTEFADCAETRSDPSTIPVGLTCRILPDYEFPGGGTCQSYCNVTEEQLKDITDNKPKNSDCNPEKWDAGGFHPGQYRKYLERKKAKCSNVL